MPTLNQLRGLFGLRTPQPQPFQSPLSRECPEVRQWVQDLATFVHEQPEQKIFDVLAFAEDGHMDFYKMCNCLLGVFSSEVLHVRCDQDLPSPWHHYRIFNGRVAKAAEYAYQWLGEYDTCYQTADGQQVLRDSYLIGVLRAGIRPATERCRQAVRDSYLIGVLRAELESRANERLREADRQAACQTGVAF